MSPELKKILLGAEDCLSDAEFNYEHERFRASSNRAYYCILDCVTALLHSKDTFSKTHHGAHIKFRQLFIKTGDLSQSLDEILLRVFDLRQSCDYDFDFEPTEADAAAAITGAQEFLEATRLFLGKSQG